MVAPRSQHTATFLGTGKVLFAGGLNAGVRVSTAELFDPGTGTFSPTAPMPEARSGHTATVLADGRVLVVGGHDLAGDFALTDEIYDPAADAFTATPVAPEIREVGHAVLLPDGRILVAGDGRCTETGGVLLRRNKPFLWNPASGVWSVAGTYPPLNEGRTASLTVLPTGRVLVLRYGPSAGGSRAYLFDPGAGDTWRPTGQPTGSGGFPTEDGILLPGGDVLFFVTSRLGFVLYDVESGAFSWPFPSVGILDRGSDASATALPDGRVLVSGGRLYTPGPEGSAVTSAEVLDPWPKLVESWRPFVSSWPSSLTMPGAFALTGTGFRGGAEASGGNGGLNSSADATAVLLRRTEGGLARWAPSSVAASWSSTSFPSATVSGLPGGIDRATLFASGLPSISRAIRVTACELTTGVLESTSSASVCQGQPLSLSARAITGATYLWSLPDGSTSTNRVLTIPDAQPEDGGLYTVVATRNGCPSPADTVAIQVSPLPQGPVMSAPSEMCVNEGAWLSVAFHAGSSYEWTLSSGTIESGQGTNEIRIRAPSTGTSMTITVVETVGATCVQPTAQVTVTLIPCNLPTPTASNTGPYCTGATISLSTPTVSGATNSLTGPYDFTSSLQNPTIPNAWEGDAGTYSVTVIVDARASAPATTTVVVYPASAAPVITAPASVAPGEHFAASVPAVAGASRTWIVTNGTLLAGDGTRQIVVVAGSTGPVTVTETYAGTGCGGPQEGSVAIPVALPATRFFPVTPCH